jgi:bifunctional non-homologous end joining protein LigD
LNFHKQNAQQKIMSKMGESKQKAASREYHPSQFHAGGPNTSRQGPIGLRVPTDRDGVYVSVDSHKLKLTNLRKPFWPELGITKGDLLQYYADISSVLLPHIVQRAMVMKRYPNGAFGDFFFMKRAPSPRPQWIATCSIEHGSGNVIDFPVIQDFASLMWVVNLGCIDLNPWYARCDDVDRPDYLHFDLDPVEGDRSVSFATVREAALLVKAALDSLKMPSFAKTTGSRGIHVYVPIIRGPTQKQVWTFAKAFAKYLAAKNSTIMTAEYRVSKRPAGRVLVDYNQNAWGRTLASVYSVRPKPKATVSTPVTWEEVEHGFNMEDFVLQNIPDRLAVKGDLWLPLLQETDRVRLENYL